MTRVLLVGIVIIGWPSDIQPVPSPSKSFKNTNRNSVANDEVVQCPPGEILDECPKFCAYDYCPTDENSDRQPCTKGSKSSCAKPACKCPFNQRRLSGVCVSVEECPPFPCIRPNEEYDHCPPYLPTDDCMDAFPDSVLENIFSVSMVRYCSPACRCIATYWRKNGVCVPLRDCPKLSIGFKPVNAII